MAKILLVEDDLEMQAVIERWLVSCNHTVEICDNGEDALNYMLGAYFDLIVLDLSLPKLDGIEVCKRYRDSRGASPIIMLTGRNLIADKVKGLDLGADDYVTKPFSVKELSSRITAILRRPRDQYQQVIAAGKFSLDSRKHTILMDEKPITLNPTDYNLIQFFIRHPNTIFSCDELIDKVWHTGAEPGNDAVRSAIKRIRQAINDTDGLIIENVKKVGYRLNT